MTDTSKSGRSVALLLGEMWRAGTLAPLFSDRMVLVVLGAVTITLVVLTAVRVTELTNLVTWIGAIYAFCWGVYTYGDKKEQSNKEPFLKEQLKLCFRASELASRLATESHPDNWDEVRHEFWSLYYGPLCIVENLAVETAMVALGEQIPKPGQPRPDRLPIADEAYRDASIALAHAARTLILNAWGVELGPLMRGSPNR
jgi:hypothetical protein